MSIFHQRPYMVASLIAGGALALLPLSYLAGWLGDLGQVKPALTALTTARQQLAWQTAHEPHQPPQGTPQLSATWTDASATLSWNKVAGATSYTIYRAPAGASFGQASAIASVSPKHHMSYTDTTVLPGTSYRYWVAADNTVGEGPASLALFVHTYLSWTTVANMGEEGAGTATLDQWSKTAWGILGSQSTKTSGPIWDVAGTLVTPLTALPTHSNWIRSQGTQWHVNGKTANAKGQTTNVTELHSSAQLPRLTTGPSTASDLALWQQNGHWITAIINRGTSPLPPSALILNQYGAVVGLTNREGMLVHA
ncbi:fibronectin type III domain-containing protein [Sulfobacillus harzensis]|uniref:Fibronectin type III domain-containing protein n=1 Tax=Sulfobacillus harzensis TaxID=2729629 RepID=A0A7Y0L4H8_9FIRM|nr:fibronectin type III domain-containing protein [Sulfobacillus harzensis]NMP22933.1 fibronectin type III domain-containing protein [Sulfobacillus harzensis]